jgi:hypothetical protein
MADKKISALTASTVPLAGTEVLPIVQSGATVKVAVSDLTAGRAVAMLTANVGDASSQNGVFDAVVGSASATTGDNTGLVVVSNATGKGWIGFNNANNSSIPGQLTYDHSTGQMGFRATGDYFFDLGNLVIGTSGKGIDFSATSGTGTSELLDDYEEGSFTPVLSDASTGGNVATIPVKSAYYTKIGRLVTFTIQLVNIDTTGMTAGNQIFIQSLPFKVADLPSSYSYPVAYSQNNMSSTTGSLAFICSFNSTYIYVVNLTTTGASNATVSQLTSGTAQIFLNGSYFVD